MTPALLAAVAGGADSAAFIATRPALVREAPGRAGGTVAAIALWAALAAVSARDGARSSGTALALAATVAAGNAAILAMHVRGSVLRPRIFVGAAAAGVALADTIRRR